jgi:predicted pyridoxine 5'-phosphate oxidase superfamily flavin-nucleotide-binding protein
MSDTYFEGHRLIHDRFDTRRLADRLEEALCTDVIDDRAKEFIQRRDMFFLSTVDPQGRPSVSYRGGDPGFVKVIDARTIAFPNYDGNGMYVSMGNLTDNPNIGMLFVDWQKGNRLRYHGTATIDWKDPLTAEWPEAQFTVRVLARQIFSNCPRYVHRMQPVQRSEFVPREGCDTPVPSWKTGDWVSDVLPAADPARNPDATVV